MCAIAARNVQRAARFGRAVRALEHRMHAVVVVCERQQLRRTFDLHAELGEAIDEQPFVLVLREREYIRKGTQPASHVTKGNATNLLAREPQVCRDELEPALHDRVGESHLAIDLERARLDRNRARRRAGLRGLVHNAHAHAQAGEIEGEHEAGWSRADNEYLCIAHLGSRRTNGKLTPSLSHESTHLSSRNNDQYPSRVRGATSPHAPRHRTAAAVLSAATVAPGRA